MRFHSIINNFKKIYKISIISHNISTMQPALYPCASVKIYNVNRLWFLVKFKNIVNLNNYNKFSLCVVRSVSRHSLAATTSNKLYHFPASFYSSQIMPVGILSPIVTINRKKQCKKLKYIIFVVVIVCSLIISHKLDPLLLTLSFPMLRAISITYYNKHTMKFW